MKSQSLFSKKLINITRKLIISSAIMLGFSNQTYAQCGAGDVGGKVFLDLPMNGSSVGVYGVKASNEPGIQGITVKITDNNGVLTTKTTDANGDWWIDSPALPIRVEFTWSSIYPFYASSVVASGSNTSVQFISTSNCTTNFALHDPNCFTSLNPKIVTSCFLNGLATGTGGGDAAIVSVNYNSTGLNSMYSNYDGTAGTGPQPKIDATINKVGSVYGIAYQKSKKRGYYASFLKRHADLLDGTGYIYVLDHSTSPATYSTKFNLNGVIPANGTTAINFGTVCRTAACGPIANDYVLPNDKTQPSVDLDAFGKVGRVSFGDIDMGPDGNTLFTTNLNSNSIITVDVSGTTLPGTVKEYKVATLAGFPTSTKGQLHIFALEFYNGKGYLGVTDDASITKVNTDLKCYVLEFDPNNVQNGFTQVLSFDPNARKPTTPEHRFNYWLNTYSEPPVTDAGYFLRFAQPILSDIEFDQYGTMYLTIMDRFGHQIGQANHKPLSGNTDYKSVQTFGDLIKACKTSTGFALEGSTGCTVAAAEFFNDQSGDCQEEGVVGSSLMIKGTDQIMTTNFDPFPGINCGTAYWNTQGFNSFSTTTGTINNWYSVYYSGNTELFGKANGLGDLEVMNDNAPVEIGNRIWKDLDNDGIQDPNESPLAGVTVALYADGGTTPIATATTDASGGFVFSNATGTSNGSNKYNLSLGFNTPYDLKVTSLGTDPAVAGLLLTRISPAPGETSGSNNTGNSLNNNDAFVIAGLPMINLTTGQTGQNNHTYDFGFATCNITATATANSPVCGGSTLNLSSTSTGASGSVSYAWAGPNSFSSTLQNPTISSVSTAAQGTYSVTLTDALGCSSTATTNVLIRSISITKTVSACINQPLQDVATVDVTVSWTNAPSNDKIQVIIGGKKEIIDVAGGATSPKTIRFVVPANGVNNQTISASWETTSCVATTTTFNAPAACSNDNLACEKILYLCGPDKPADGDAFDHGFINYLLANNPSVLTPAFTKPDASGNGLYDVSNTNTLLNINLNDYTMVIVSPTTESNLASNLLTSLKGFSGGVLMMNYAQAESLGMTSGAATYNFQTNAYTNNTNQVEIYNYDNSNPTYTNVLTGGTYHSVGDAYLWFGANDMSAGMNGISFYYSPSDVIPSVPATHGARAYLGYHMNGLYSNSQNGGAMPAPASSYLVPTQHFTLEGKNYFDQAIKSIATGVAVSAVGDTACAGGTVNLSAISLGATSYQWTGPNSFSSTVQNPVLNNVSSNATGTYTVTVTGTAGCTATATTYVLINTIQAPTSAGASRCGTGSLSLTATGCTGGTITWYGSLTGGSALTTGLNYTTSSLNSTTTYYLECSKDGCVSQTRNSAIATINALPTASISGTDNLTCSQNSVTRTAAGGVSYQWSNNLGTNAVATISAAGTYTVTVTNQNGCSATATTSVTIDSNVPTVSVSGTENLTCTTTSVTRTASGAASYVWSNGLGTNASVTISTAGTYTVTAMASNGCTATATTTVSSNTTPPTATISTNNAICSNGTIALSASGGTTYFWYGPNSFTSTLQNPTISSATSNMTGNYSVTVTNSSGCTASAYVFVRVISLSATVSSVNCNANGTLSNSDDDYFTFLLTPTGYSGGKYTISATQGGNPITVTLSDGTATGELKYAYPSPLRTPIGAAGKGNIIITLSDVENPSCTTTITVTDPGTCNANTCTGTPQTVTYTYRIPFQSTDLINIPLNIPKFDTEGGSKILSKAVLKYGISKSTNFITENTAASSTTFDEQYSGLASISLGSTILSDSTFTYTESQNLPARILVNQQGAFPGDSTNGTVRSTIYGMSKWLYSQLDDIFSNPTTDSRWVSNATGVSTNDDDMFFMPARTSNLNDSTIYTTQTDLNQLVGTGYLPLKANTDVSVNFQGAGGNAIWMQRTKAYAYVTVTYTYSCCIPPSGVTASNNSPICSGSSVNLSSTSTNGTAYSWTGPNGYTSTSQNPTLTNVTTSGIYTVVVSGIGACTATATTNVIVNEIPTAPTSSGANRCGEGTLTLSASGCANGTITWFDSLTGGSPLSTGNTFTTPILSNTTTYYIECSKDGCTSLTRNSAVATINTMPTNLTVSSNSPVWTGNSINLSASATGASNYSWAGPNSFTSTTQNPTIINAQEVNEGVYTVTAISAGGCTITATTNVIVYNLLVEPLPQCTTTPTLTSTSNSPIVAGSTLNLSSNSSSAIAYAWNGPNGFTSLSQNPTISNATTQMAGIYTVTVTPNGVCSETSTVQVTIGCFSNVSASNNSPVCEGQSVNLSASSASSYSWLGPNGFSSTAQNPIINASTPLVAGVYTVTLTGQGGCSATATTNVTVNQLPIATIDGSTNIDCNNTSVSRTASGGGTYLWSGPNSFSSTAASITVSVTGTYTVTVANVNGCSASASTVITSNTTPPTASITGSESLSCTNSSVSRTAQTGESYSWSGPNSFNSTSATITVSVAGTYTVTVKGSNGCTATATTTVNADNSFPNISLTTTEDTLTCSVPSAILTASVSPVGTYTYAWSNATSGNNITVYDAGTFSVVVTGANGCTASASITIQEINTVTAVMNVTDVLCKGGNNGKVVVTPIEGKAPFQFKLAAGAFQSGNTFENLVVGTYPITVKDAGGCTASIEVIVHEPQENLGVSISATENIKCKAGNTGSLTATATGGTIGYSYSIGGTFQSSGVFASLVAGSYTITAKDANGCTATTTASLTEPTAILPTATGSQITCSVSTGTISASATGGSPTYTFSKDGANFQTSNVFTNLTGGTYTITIKDINNCLATTTANISVGDTATSQFSAVATSVTCSGSDLNVNGKITLSNFISGHKYQYSVGTTFSASGAIPAAPTTIPTGGVIVSNLANPTGITQAYTIRVFNAEGCYKDVVVNLLQTQCNCKPAICIPVRIQKSR